MTKQESPKQLAEMLVKREDTGLTTNDVSAMSDDALYILLMLGAA